MATQDTTVKWALWKSYKLLLIEKKGEKSVVYYVPREDGSIHKKLTA